MDSKIIKVRLLNYKSYPFGPNSPQWEGKPERFVVAQVYSINDSKVIGEIPIFNENVLKVVLDSENSGMTLPKSLTDDRWCGIADVKPTNPTFKLYDYYDIKCNKCSKELLYSPICDNSGKLIYVSSIPLFCFFIKDNETGKFSFHPNYTPEIVYKRALKYNYRETCEVNK